MTERAAKDYKALLVEIQELVNKQFVFLLTDLRYPSLRAKQYDEGKNLWQGRIDRYYRFYFIIDGECLVILTISKHPK